MAANSGCRCLCKSILCWPSRFGFNVQLRDTSTGHKTVTLGVFWPSFSAHFPNVCVCVCVLSTFVSCLLYLIPFLPVCNSVIPSKPFWSHSVLLCSTVYMFLRVFLADVLPVLSACVSSCYVFSLAPRATEVCVCLMCRVPPAHYMLCRYLQSCLCPHFMFTLFYLSISLLFF